jgi:hypothetical protein
LGRESQIIARDRRQVRSEVRQVFSARKVASAFTVVHFYQNDPDLSTQMRFWQRRLLFKDIAGAFLIID